MLGWGKGVTCVQYREMGLNTVESFTITISFTNITICHKKEYVYRFLCLCYVSVKNIADGFQPLYALTNKSYNNLKVSNIDPIQPF